MGVVIDEEEKPSHTVTKTETIKTWISSPLVYRLGNESQMEFSQFGKDRFPFPPTRAELTLLEYLNPSSYMAAPSTISGTL